MILFLHCFHCLRLNLFINIYVLPWSLSGSDITVEIHSVYVMFLLHKTRTILSHTCLDAKDLSDNVAICFDVGISLDFINSYIYIASFILWLHFTIIISTWEILYIIYLTGIYLPDETWEYQCIKAQLPPMTVISYTISSLHIRELVLWKQHGIEI